MTNYQKQTSVSGAEPMKRTSMRTPSRNLYLGLVAIAASAFCASANADMGRTNGGWGVSPSGAATYSVPLWVQPGPRNMQPSLAFAYNSQGGNGTMGVGWSLSGFSAIDRCPGTVSEDGADQPVTVTATDRFCLGGSKLRITSGPLSSYGSTGAVYQTSIADFSRVTSVGTAGTGPQSFLVHTKEGLILEFGNTADSRVILSGTTVFRWMLNKVSDRDGNSYVVTYATDNATGRVPLTVSWGPTTAGASTYQYQAAFNYTNKANSRDWVSARQGSITLVTKQRLDSVTIGYSASGSSYSTKHQYQLAYALSPTTGLTRLTTITECAATTSNCLKPTSIAYQDGTSGVVTTGTTAVASASAAANASKADFNGDGRTDILYSDGTVWRVAFSTGSGFGAGVSTGIASSTAVSVGRFVSTHQDGLLYASGSTWNYTGYNGSAFTASSTGAPWMASTVITDYNGDGLQDLMWYTVVTNGSTKTATLFLRPNTTGGAATVPTFAASATTSMVFSGLSSGGGLAIVNSSKCPIERQCDLNGDSRADLQLVVANPQGCGPSGCSSTYTGYDLLGGTALANSTPQQLTTYFGLRFNDDRCTDTIQTGTTTLRVSSCGDAAVSNITLPAAPVAVMDWDGDGRTDLLVNSGGFIGVYRSRGSTTTPFDSLVTTTIPYSSNCSYYAADVDGDGLDELVCARTASPFSVTYYTHNGAGSAGSAGGSMVFATQVPDIASSITDGFGIAVSPFYVSTAQSNYTKGTGTALPLVDATDAMIVVGRMRVSDGIGATYDLDYTYKGARRNASLGHGGAGAVGQRIDYVGDTVGAGASGSVSRETSAPDGQFAGFEEISVVDSRSGLKRRTVYEQLFPLVGMVKQTDAYQSNQTTLISRVVNTNTSSTLDATANNTRYFTYLSQSVSDDYEVGGALDGQLITSTTRTFTYTDPTYGNLSGFTSVVTDKDSSSIPSLLNSTWTTTITNSYETALTSGTDWCVGFVNQVQTAQSSTVPGAISVTRTNAFAPDSGSPGKCRVKTKTIEPSSSKYRVTETYGYDAFGNVNSASVVGRQPIGGGAFGDMAARSTSLDWGTTGQFATTITDAAGAVSGFTYNFDTGTLQKLADPNSTGSNPIEVSYQYDGFGRKTRQTGADGTYATWSYDDCAAAAGCLNSSHRMTVTKSYFDNAGQLTTDETTYLDALGRALVSRSRLMTGSTWNGSYQWSETQYDAFGHKLKDYMPCVSAGATSSCRTNATTYTYDAIGRVTQSSRPRSATDGTAQTTLTSFAGRTRSVTDPLGKTSAQVFDATGAVRQTRDANGYAINFTYDAAGAKLGVVDSLFNSKLSGVTVEYGITAFAVTSNDSALGPSSRVYNSLGELVSGTDSKGQTFSATYDALSRPLTRLEPNAATSTTWTWGSSSASFNIGQLASVSSTENGNTYTENYSYDGRMRLQSKTIAIPGDGSYTFDYAYQPNKGWLDTLTYPATTGSRLTLKYTYLNGGLQKVSDLNTSAVYWSGDASNAWGQVTNETLGGLIGIARNYDAVTARLNTIQAGIGADPTSLQSYSYLYDLVGNITQRQNNKRSLTESFYYGNGSDNLYRLDHSTLSDGSTTITNASFTYDPSGNILSKTTAGVADPLIGQTITWTSYNYPAQITSNSDTATFSYGPNRQRWKMVYTSGGLTETTLYIGGLLEKVTSAAGTDYRHTIYAGERAVAIQSRLGTGSPVTRFLLADNLGSVETIADSAGTRIANEAFSAFGERRDATNWSANAPADRATLDSITRQGFTFQTVLGSMGLNHMNGRVQDAVTGRFLSADTHLGEPAYTQNYNRYSYVYNNPLTFRDPTGFDCNDNSASDPKNSDPKNNNSGYQNGSVTASGMADCMDEVVVTGHKPPSDPKPPTPEIPHTPDPRPDTPNIDPHQQTGGGTGDGKPDDVGQDTPCKAYAADESADSVAEIKNDLDEPVKVTLGDFSTTLQPGESSGFFGVKEGKNVITGSDSREQGYSGSLTLPAGQTYSFTIRNVIDRWFYDSMNDLSLEKYGTPLPLSQNPYFDLHASDMFPVTVDVKATVIAPVYKKSFKVHADTKGACVKR